MSTGRDTAIGNGTVVTDRGVQAEVLTADGVHLRYINQGAGRPVVFVHGWLSCAEHWRPVAAPIAGMARAVTYDQRGHGASDGTEHGWTVHRLARDLDELLAALAISGAVLVGHSMGCSVIWAYLELFGASRVDGLVLVDQSPALVIDPVWDKATIARAGAMFRDEELRSLCRGVANPQSRVQVHPPNPNRDGHARLPLCHPRPGIGVAPSRRRLLCRRAAVQPRPAGLAPADRTHHIAHAGRRRPRQHRALDWRAVDR